MKEYWVAFIDDFTLEKLNTYPMEILLKAFWHYCNPTSDTTAHAIFKKYDESR